MKTMKKVLAVICVMLILFGIIYNVVALPFSSPKFDVIAWIAIGVAFLIATYLGRSNK
jgi:hypothetical protein